MTNKIVYDMPEAEYFAADAASNSTLGRMKRSPRHCKEYMDNPPETTASMRLGKIVHKLVLEGMLEFGREFHVKQEHDPTLPRKTEVVAIIEAMQAGKFDELFMVDDGSKVAKPRGAAEEIAERLLSGSRDEILPLFAVSPTNISKRTTEGKAKYAEFQAKCEREGLTICKQEDLDKACKYVDWMHTLAGRTLVKEPDVITAANYVNYLKAIEGRTVITPEELETAQAMAKTINEHPSASKLLTGGRAEASAFWTDPETGYPCKCRFDYLNHMEYIVDLKTTNDASLEEFSRSIAKFGYHRQNAMYMDGYEVVMDKPAKAFIFIAVESKPPHAVGVYNLDLEGIDKGRTEYRDLLKKFAHCKKTDEWPAYSEQVETIELPRWYINRG